MHKTGIHILVLVLAFVSSTIAQDKAQSEEYATAQAVGKEVQRALKSANETGLSGKRLQKAVLTLETGTTVTGSVELNFIIFTIKHSQKKGKTQNSELVFELPQSAGEATRKPPESLTEPLSKAIAMAAATASQITALPFSEATISIDFAVDKDTSGNLSFKLLGGTIGGGVDLDKVPDNKLTVTFR